MVSHRIICVVNDRGLKHLVIVDNGFDTDVMLKKCSVPFEMPMIYFLLVVLLGCDWTVGDTDVPDAITRMVTQEGYTIRRHTVTTDDGYLLGLYHLSAANHSSPNAPIVLVMHGLFASAADYLTLGRKYSLAYILADAGCDVWLGNSRGTTFSRAHRTRDPDAADGAFWNYSFHEIGLYDLPAMIDYIRSKTDGTGNRKLHYVAHSQGCTAFAVMLALRPEYSAHVRTMQAMAPAVFLSESKAVDDVVLRYIDQLQQLSQRLNLYEVSAQRPELQQIVRTVSAICPAGSLLQMLCVNVYFSSFAANLPPLSKRMARNIIASSPNIVSVKQLMHFGQLIRSGRFQQYDYGETANRRIYGTVAVPEYPLKGRCNVSMQVFYGLADTVTPPQDVQRFIDVCDPFVEREVPAVGANHFDYVLSKDAREKYYGKIVAMIRKSGVGEGDGGMSSRMLSRE